MEPCMCYGMLDFIFAIIYSTLQYFVPKKARLFYGPQASARRWRPRPQIASLFGPADIIFLFFRLRKIEEKSQLTSKRNSCKKLPPKRNTLQHVPCPTTPKEHYQNNNASEFNRQNTKKDNSERPKRPSKSAETTIAKSTKPVLTEQNSQKSQGYQSLEHVDESTSTYLSPSGSISNENHSFANYCKTIQYEQLNSSTRYATRINQATGAISTVNNSATLHQYPYNINRQRPTILSNTKSYEAVFTFNQSTLI